MAFKNEALQLLANRFKKRFKALDVNVKAWAIDSEVSLNSAYSYMDINRPDNHLPAFLLATLPMEARENLFQMLRDMALFKEDKPKYHAPISELLLLHYKLLKEFSDVTRTLAEAMEDGKITQEEFSSYEKERAEFLAIDAQLHARMRRETEWFKDNDFYA